MNNKQLAKEYHPDLNPQIPSQLSQTKMSELIHAYDQLMDDDFLGRVGDGRVALACEMFTLQELKMDRFHDVYSIQIRYYEDEEDSGNNDDNENKGDNEKDVERQNKADSAFDTVNDSNSTRSDISTFHLIEHKAHPDDSISDIKRQLQSLYQTDWGLEGRRLDRDKLATGWEIVCTSTDTDTDNRLSNDVPDSTEVMSYHLFLHSYNISDGDIVHAVVRRYIDEES
jgi:curved DNA-binding protein CbpA